jgi:inorganic pyrophosphatase
VRIKVFVQNETGSALKNYHDEKTLEFKFTKRVSRPYPFPYGFIVGTTARDGCNLDCYIITRKRLKTGTTVDCEPVGLMEQFEDGVEDHNVLANLTDEPAEMTTDVQEALIEFVQNVFSHSPTKRVQAGRFLHVSEAETYILDHVDTGPT